VSGVVIAASGLRIALVRMLTAIRANASRDTSYSARYRLAHAA